MSRPGARFDPELALSLLAAFRRYALGALALHAGLLDRPTPSPSLAPLRDQITTTLETLAEALRHGTRPGPLPPLRQTLQRIQPSIDPIVAEQTDVIVDSVDTMAAIPDAAAGVGASRREASSTPNVLTSNSPVMPRRAY